MSGHTRSTRLTGQQRPTDDLYFDADTSLLVKSTGPCRLSQAVKVRESYFSEFEMFDGVKLATRVAEFHDNRKTAELVVKYIFPASVSDMQFDTP